MKKVLLIQKIQNIKKAGEFQHKLIDSIYKIIQLKRKSQSDYMMSLQIINKQLQKYINQQNGFLNQIIKSFQSYITVIYQNKSALIQGYDNEILQFLLKSKESKMEDNLIKRVQEFDVKINQNQISISNFKKLVRDYQTEMQLLASQIELGRRIEAIPESKLKEYAEKYVEFKENRDKNEQLLENQVNKMMELTMMHNVILKDLDDYETIYLQNKGLEVFDNFKRAFVLQVSFIRNMQFDIGNILQKMNQRQNQSKKVALDMLQKSMKKNQYRVSEFLLQTYKKVANSYTLDIKQNYINQRIRNKWKRICQYYNQAS